MKKNKNDGTLVFKENFEKYDNLKDFQSLKAWMKCREIKLYFYQIILPKLPKEENFVLGTQIRRAAISVTSNIAEGYGRYHYQEGIRFYRISRASLYELKDHLVSCLDFNYVTETEYYDGIILIEEGKRLLNGYINYLGKKIKKN
jgi:four helix bundle protein